MNSGIASGTEGFLDMTIGQVMSENARKYGDREMVKYTDRDYRRTWREFDEETETIARGFMSLGLKKGAHIAIWATNVPEWLLTFFASAKIGGVLVTVNTNYRIFELEYLLRQSDTQALVLIDGVKNNNYIDTLNELCPTLKDSEPGNYNDPKLPFLKSIIYVGPNETPAGMINFKELYTLAEKTPYDEFRKVAGSCTCHEVANMQYTSGTTGFPKGVMLSHYNILNNGLSIGDCMKFTPDDKLCICVPLFHCFGIVLAVMACITHGTSMVPIDSFSPIKVMSALQNERCTACHGVPTMFIAMMEHPRFSEFNFSSMRTGIMAGSPCPIKAMQDVIAKMNMSDITIVFGQTELSPGCTQTNTDDSVDLRVHTVGRALPGVECKVVDPNTGKDLGPGQIGEFCARGYNVMKGYYKMPEATAAVIDEDGWLHSGDLVMVDEDGYYKVTGRIKDMIIRGGENIYPKELEDFLYTHPKVKDVQVIGVPSEQYGEEVMACIILKNGEEMTEEEVIEFFLKNMSKHKKPSHVWFMDEFPMTASGKIQKFVLRDMAVERLNLHNAASIETA